MHITLVGLNARYTHSCLALFYVRNELLARLPGSLPRISQFTINDAYYDLLLQLTETEADAYFFSASIWNSDLVAQLVRDLLHLDECVRCVIGGPQAEVVHDSCRHDRLAVVVGPIEQVDEAFYADLAAGKARGRYAAAAPADANFSSPYIASDYQNHLRNRHVYYESSRGCPHSCSYCLSSVRKGVFHKDLDLVKKELAVILSWHPPVVRFVDRTFNTDPERSLAIWRFLVERAEGVVFHFEMSPDRFNEEMFAFLATLPPATFQFELGIQSTHAPTLAAIGRRIDLAAAAKNIRRLADLNSVHLHVDLILGLPGETETSFLEGFRDVFAMQADHVQMGLLKLLPGTSLSRSADRYGYVCSARTPYPVLANHWLDHGVLRRLHRFGECVEGFVNNRYFLSLWRWLRREEEDVVLFFLGLHAFCQRYDFHHRAPTQEFLLELLANYLRERQGDDSLLELLRYDWLRCGHRHLPACIEVAEELSSKNIRRRLFRLQKENRVTADCGEELFFFLKKGFFVSCSRFLLAQLGRECGDGECYLCFVAQREEDLHRFSRVALFSVSPRG